MRTVKQVAKASGVSVRALHHYDHIGLLTPETGANGYRLYGQEHMLRLQQILFYRELGVPLAEIARILDDPGYDTRGALIDLRRRVEGEIRQRRDLARTIDHTLSLLDAGKALDEKRLFDGVSREQQAAWEAEIVERYGDQAAETIAQSQAAVAALSSEDFLALRRDIDRLHQAFVTLIEAGGTPGSPAAQALTAQHYDWVCRSWRPDAQAYAALGQLYCDQGDFRDMYDGLHPHLAAFLAAAMAVYAQVRLQGPDQ